MVRGADELIERIVKCSGIPAGKRRREIQRELRAHIEDIVAAAREAGSAEDEIAQLVLARFGDAGQIGRDFAWVYRHERRRLQVLAYTISTVLLAGSLLAAILTMQAGLAFSFGTPALKMLGSRHTVIEALDILASVAVYLGLTSLADFFESRRFGKSVGVIAAIVAILVAACGAAGLRTSFLLFGLLNGVFLRAVQLLVVRKAARFGIAAVCFPVAGIVMAMEWSPLSPAGLAATGASWVAMGVSYQLMTQLAARVDAALRNGLQRMHAGY